MPKNKIQTLQNATIIFWDFDGVIKESVEVKSVAFEQLFLPFGREVARKVRKHHEEHSGVSRYDKIPVYLSWVGLDATNDIVREYCEKFSRLVKQAVINASWVPGAREYILENCEKQYFVLITATPQEEIEQILAALDLTYCFREIYGAPMKKEIAIHDVLERLQCENDTALVIGDSEADFKAADKNNLMFLLRRTEFNKALQERFTGISIGCLKF